MILHGIRIALNPQRGWESFARPQGFGATWLVVAAMTASTIPTIAVVAGHLGSSWLGYTAKETAIQRAAIGFVAASIGAVVMAAAMALAFFKIAKDSRIDVTPEQAPFAAMGIIWPAWICGAVLAVPPLLNMGPEIGEVIWMLLATLCVLRVVTKGASDWLGVRRRWRSQFRIETLGVFVLLFAAIPVFPALLVRYLVGVTGTIAYGDPSPLTWPVPPEPNW